MAVTEVTPTAGAGLNPAFAEEFDGKFRDAFNAHDADALLALLADDVTYIDPSWPKEMHGKDDVRAYLASIWRSSSDMSVEHLGAGMLDPKSPRASRRWRLTGTGDGVWDPPGLQPTGAKFTVEGVAVFEFRGDKLADARQVFDVAGLMRQVGALPPTGSIGERVVLIGRNLITRLRRH